MAEPEDRGLMPTTGRGRGWRTPEVTLAHLLTDLHGLAQRLRCRRISSTLYRREGGFCWTTKLKRRVGNLTWSEVCQLAGLLPTARGCRGIDRRPCTRCGRQTNWYGPGSDGLCKECRHTIRRRKTCLGWEDAA